ncbi:hypothetical protein [Plastoroseomonas arctica]|uniref:Uncharacterized protein n=1 Tax=Plastoroseomonas arctica TaxID=1509237 RepID=A0AAF1JYT0_9PROT|nr:hypothetical protein [Plastoroseomonas arctica]MBR0655163.1 hypothetical protein [Plastoroseomonas arctica]
MLALLASGAALAQGSVVPVWERRSGDWSVALTGTDRRCLMAGTTQAPAHQVRLMVRPSAAAPAPRPGARPQAAPAAAARPELELAENIGGVHVSAPVGTPLALVAEGRSFGFQVTSAFPGGFRAVSTTDFSMDWARSREVFLDTGRAEALRLSATGLSAAGAAMAECIAGRVPR